MKIDFYILDTTSRQQSWLFACSLIEKAYATGQRVYIHTSTQDEADRMNTLLWTYRDDSFIPHDFFNDSYASPPPIQIGFAENIKQSINPDQPMTLMNLSPHIPSFYQQFNHVIEIVFNDTLVQQLARERYKQYRDQGHELNTVK